MEVKMYIILFPLFKVLFPLNFCVPQGKKDIGNQSNSK